MRFLSLFTLLAFAFILPIGQSVAATSPPLAVGTVKYLRGSAVAIRGVESVPLAKGSPIYEGDLIKTGKRSSIFASMAGDKSNSIKMGQKSQLEVKKYTLSKTGNVIGGFLRGLIGIFSVELNNLRRGSSFSMHTPTAVLGVRGTVWGSVVKADGSTTFAVTRGSISVKMGGKTVLLKKGQTVTVSKSGKVSAVTKTPPALQDSIDSDGSTFDNAAAEKATLETASADLEDAKEEVEKAEDALQEATDSGDQDAIDQAEKAVDIAEGLALAAEVVQSKAEDAFKVADAAIPEVSFSTQSSATNTTSTPDTTDTDTVNTTEATASPATTSDSTTPTSTPTTSSGGGAASPQ